MPPWVKPAHHPDERRTSAARWETYWLGASHLDPWFAPYEGDQPQLALGLERVDLDKNEDLDNNITVRRRAAPGPPGPP